MRQKSSVSTFTEQYQVTSVAFSDAGDQVHSRSFAVKLKLVCLTGFAPSHPKKMQLISTATQLTRALLLRFGVWLLKSVNGIEIAR